MTRTPLCCIQPDDVIVGMVFARGRCIRADMLSQRRECALMTTHDAARQVKAQALHVSKDAERIQRPALEQGVDRRCIVFPSAARK